MHRQQMKKWAQYRYRITNRSSIADPYTLIDISPNAVQHLVSPQFQNDLPSDGTYIVGGDWDRTLIDSKLYFFNGVENTFENRTLVPLDKYVFYQSVENHIRRGVPWSETEFYQWTNRFDDFPDHILYGNDETREWRFNQLDRLAESIRAEGYKTQQECTGDASIVSGEERVGTTVSRWVHSNNVPPEFHEVMINIGRGGQLIFEEGRHRFAVARALELESIPVRVFVRHVEWQKKRQELSTASSYSELSKETKACLSHPDLASLRTF